MCLIFEAVRASDLATGGLLEPKGSMGGLLRQITNIGNCIAFTYGYSPMRVDPRQLSILLAVARAGSFSEAGRVVGLTQPAISTAVAGLERALGAKLLDRGRNGSVPTPAGEIAIRRAEAIEAIIAQTRKEIDLERNGIAGPLHVGGTPGALMSLVPRALQRCKEQFKALEIRVSECNDGDIVKKLRSREIDLAICTVGFESPPEDVCEISIAQDAFELVVRRDHPINVQFATLEEMSRLAWVLPADKGAFHRHIDALFIAHDVPRPRDVVFCDSLATTKEIIRQTDYVTIMPKMVAAAEVESGSLRTIRLKQWLLTREIGIRAIKDGSLSPAATAFIEALQRPGGSRTVQFKHK